MFYVKLVELVYLSCLTPFASKATLLKYEKLVYPVMMLLLRFNCPGLKFVDYFSVRLLLFRVGKLNFLNMGSCWLLGELVV